MNEPNVKIIMLPYLSNREIKIIAPFDQGTKCWPDVLEQGGVAFNRRHKLLVSFLHTFY